MPDYKEMYLNLVRASEEAINTLIRAQRECEEIFINCMDARDGDQARKNLWVHPNSAKETGL